MHTIWVNEEPISVEINTSIDQLLQKINVPTSGIAVAVNTKIHAQDHWETILLEPDDKVLIIQATQGG